MTDFEADTPCAVPQHSQDGRTGPDARCSDPRADAEALRTTDDPTPTTGPPDPWWDERPMGCTCYVREDVEYGDMWTQPVGGCEYHAKHGEVL